MLNQNVWKTCQLSVFHSLDKRRRTSAHSPSGANYIQVIAQHTSWKSRSNYWSIYLLLCTPHRQTLQFSTENFRQSIFLFPMENFRHYFFPQKIFDTFWTEPWNFFDTFWNFVTIENFRQIICDTMLCDMENFRHSKGKFSTV